MLALALLLQVDFARDVEPLLKAHCLKCHGADKARGQLRLDARGFALKGGATGPAIVPGKSAESLFIKLLLSADEDERMPAKAPALPPETIARLRRWIDEGAVWPDTGAAAAARKHWAYEKPVRPEPPRKDVAPIDAFLLARMGGLTPTPEASRETLIRRLSLDLVGLPPSPEEVDAFVADGDYGKLVDRLLASPHYGERWARPWLDLARYADTNGFNIDSRRSMWKWRDWVIEAFNRDLPFDRFTIEQFAGDLLPDATEETRIATGFHRNTMLNEEGGVDPDEARWERLLDRASTTATVWLGSTYACAQCHNHKYDPISQKDFYRLVAFFETQNEASMDFATPEQRAKREELARRKKAGEKVDKLEKELRASIATTLVFTEKKGAEPATHLRIRGGYESRGELVKAGVSEAFHAWPEGAPLDRLGLARWLVSPENPLVARVTVNRLWDALFGRPLVETPEDFGTQAPPPTHPELLDWLATEFMRGGWSQKRLLRTIVTSAAYKRDSRVSKEHLAADPQNKLHARGARFRLEAETIRDVQLAASGLLSRKIGGPSVFPLQADTSGAIAINKTDMTWKLSPGEDRYRRGLYTFWRRTAPFVAFALFDAPTREQCVVRRTRTNTPLQALSALNDPAAWDAAKALGKLMEESSLEEGFRRCVSRRPSKDELALLEKAVKRDGWALAANVLLNLDETLTRE